jgi:hypothetical protein
MLIFGWIFGALFVGLVFGAARKIGFFLSFIASLFLSPLIGLIITLCSETKTKAADRKRMIELQEENNRLLRERK